MNRDGEVGYLEEYNSYEVVISGVEYCIWWGAPLDRGVFWLDEWDSAMYYEDESGKQVYDITARSF